MPSAKEKLIYKIIMIVLGLITMGVGVYMVLVMFGAVPSSGFAKHFAIAICLACISGITFCLPLATRTKYGGDQAKDDLVMGVAVILFLLAIVSCVLSYFGFGIL